MIPLGLVEERGIVYKQLFLNYKLTLLLKLSKSIVIGLKRGRALDKVVGQVLNYNTEIWKLSGAGRECKNYRERVGDVSRGVSGQYLAEAPGRRNILSEV